MSTTTTTTYMSDPPPGEARWAAGSFAPSQRAIGASVFAVATFVFTLRLFTRLRLIKAQLLADDYLCGISLVSCWTFYGCTVGMMQNGGCGRNIWQVTETEYEELLKWTVPVNIFYMLSSDFAKLSLLVFYLNLSPDRMFRIVVKMIGLCFVLYAVAYALTSIFSCSPVYASWDLAAAASSTASCINKEMFYLAASIANICMDVIILLVPLRIVVPLQIPKRQKVSLLLLFATGGFVILVAIYNCTLTVSLFNSNNYTRGLAYELSWMYGELAGCVVCASASSLKPFFVRYLPTLLSSRLGTSGTTALSASNHNQHQLSRGGGTRRQWRGGRVESGDAYELTSHDGLEGGGSSSSWGAGPGAKGEGYEISVSVDKDAVQARWKASIDGGKGGTAADVPMSPTIGISVMHTTEISYSRESPSPKQ